uniref:Uncharacterized protein n=1 Tax=Eutreptiella gymnastica TaxID=73025 RepID=A0A7S4CP75_9EUGL
MAMAVVRRIHFACGIIMSNIAPPTHNAVLDCSAPHAVQCKFGAQEFTSRRLTTALPKCVNAAKKGGPHSPVADWSGGTPERPQYLCVLTISVYIRQSSP